MKILLVCMQYEMYLEDDGLRQTIAEAGNRRTLADHTFPKRFRAVFQQMGFYNEC